MPKDQTASWLPVFLGRIDSALGMQIERAVMSHHKRRLGRLGQVAALETRAPGWASQGARPQAGNRFEVLVDGSSRRQAQSRKHVSGAARTPPMALGRSRALRSP